jgi:hypothetical protein
MTAGRAETNLVQSETILLQSDFAERIMWSFEAVKSFGFYRLEQARANLFSLTSLKPEQWG